MADQIWWNDFIQHSEAFKACLRNAKLDYMIEELDTIMVNRNDEDAIALIDQCADIVLDHPNGKWPEWDGIMSLMQPSTTDTRKAA